MNARATLQAAGQTAASTPAPRVLSLWPIDRASYFDDVKPEYRFASDALHTMSLFRGEWESAAAAAMLAARNASAYGERPAKLNAIDNLETLQSAALSALAHIVGGFLNEASRASTLSSAAFAEIAGELAAWQDNAPEAIQRAIREFAHDWATVMEGAGQRFKSAAKQYQGVLDKVQAAASQRAALLGEVVESYEEELAAQRQLIQELQRHRGLLQEAIDQVDQAVNTARDIANRTLKGIERALRNPWLWVGGGAAVATVGALFLWSATR